MKKKRKSIKIPAPNAFGNVDVEFFPTGSFVIDTVDNSFFKDLRKNCPCQRLKGTIFENMMCEGGEL